LGFSIFIMEEKWIPIAGYEGFYEISTLGRVKRIIGATHPKVSYLKCEIVPKTGYCRITLSKLGVVKRFFLHRLVMLCFRGYSELNVDHINSDKQDNRLCNLQYITQRENIVKHTSTKKSSSIYTGVTYVKKMKKWKASLGVSYKTHHLGFFEHEIDAANAYVEALKKLTNDN